VKKKLLLTKLVKNGKLKTMKLSTKSTYGLRAMVRLALEYGRGPVSILDIAKREEISVPYLEQLLNRLRRRGLVESVRGPKGGYSLAAAPGDITVKEVVRALEGNIAPVYCIGAEGAPPEACTRRAKCVTKYVWAKLGKAIEECLESITLEDLRSRQKAR
jgi:Rrf2 family protein